MSQTAHMVPPVNPERTGKSDPTRPKPLDQPLLLLGIVGGFLAISTVFAKAAPGIGWHPLALLQWSLGGSAVFLLAGYRIISGRNNSSDPSARPAFTALLPYLAISGLLFIAPNMIAVMAAPRVGAGFVSLSYAFPLVLTYAIAVAIRLERFQLLRGLGVLAGVVGGLLLATGGAEVSATATVWSFVALAIPVFLAAGNIFRTLKWPRGAQPVELAIGMMAVGFVALAVFNVILGLPLAPKAWSGSATTLLAAQTVMFALQYGLYFRLQEVAGPVYLSQIGSVAAVIGLALGYLVFGEVPNAAKIAAVLSVGLGIVLVTLGKGRN